MKKQSLITILLTLLMIMTGTKTFAHDIAVPNSDGVTIYYNWVNSEKTEVSVSYYYDNGRIFYSGEVVIPESVVYEGKTYSVTSIGYEAFANCKKLTSVTIPNSVVSIDDYAFKRCESLKSITIPNSVTSIGIGAFSDCNKLASITIPSSVISIGRGTFDGTAWFVNLPNGLVYAGSVAYKYKGEIPVNTNITIIDGTTQIADYAFSDCSGLTSIIIPNSVTTIGMYAFYGCSGLTSIIIPNGVTTIDMYTFTGCSGLTSFIIPNGVTTIGLYAFSGCSGLTSIIIPNSVTNISSRAFSDCEKLSKVYFYPQTPPSIGSSVFSSSSYIFVSESIFDSYYFSSEWRKYNYQLHTKEIDPVEIDGIYYYLYAMDPIAEVTSSPNKYIDKPKIVIPENITYENRDYKVKYIGDYAFSNCSSLISVTPQNSVTSIGKSAFSNCNSLTSVSIPEGITSIGDNAFSGCSSLTSVAIPNSVASIGVGVFAGCSSMISASIQNGITSIGENTFYGCSSLTSVAIPNSVTLIGKSAFCECSSLASISIPNSVISIGESAFFKCSSLTSVTIPSSVTTIGSIAFSYCNKLSNVNIYDIVAWCNIDFGSEYSNPLIYAKHLFINKEEITDLVIPDNVTTIKKYAFHNCAGLTSVSISNNVTSIGDQAFQNCLGLNKLSIGNKVTTIGISAFHGCSSLTSVTIPNSVTTIGESAFYSCESIKSVNIPSSINLINESTFGYCSRLTSLVLTEGLAIIKKQAFSECRSLESVTIPSSVEYIYQEAFSNCYGLKFIKALSDTPPFLYDNSFSDYNVPVIVPTKSVDTYKEAQGWKNFYNINDKTYYKLKYMVDGAEYKSYNYEIGTDITPEVEPTKDGYTFSGWNEVPNYMPAKDVTVSGSFTINKYKLTYLVENEVYKTLEIEYGLKINKSEAPTKDGYVFSGFIDIPETMPSHDLEINGRFYLSGDANGDGVVNIADIVEIVNFINNKPSEKFDQLAANVTGDDKVNEDDIAAILDVIMNK